MHEWLNEQVVFFLLITPLLSERVKLPGIAGIITGGMLICPVVLPEFVPAHRWEANMHNQTAWLLKTALLYHRRQLGFQRVIIDVPYYLRA